ncbi:MAG TPA: XRE family transcriptional regulator [Sulfurovum sp.]|nr:XRE family transcriptional regulator [Sulfurovum sp.]
MDFKEFGKTIAIMRKEKKVSQGQMAQDLNISRATISALENARTADIGIRKILQIIDYLGYELDFKEKSAFPTFEELRDEK